MPSMTIILQGWTPDAIRTRLAAEFPGLEVIDGRQPADLERHLPRAAIVYGTPPAAQVPRATNLKWIQLNSAGVPLELCAVLKGREVVVTNLTGLYGPTIAEHALGLILMLARNLHAAVRQQVEGKWQRDLRNTMFDLHGRTIAVVGLGNIGQNLARLCRGMGMRVIGCRRRPGPTPHVDQLYKVEDLGAMLGEADVVAVAAPLTWRSDGLLGPVEFAALKSGAVFVNVSRGRVAEEEALLAALREGRIAGAGLDAFAVEPLPPGHPFWTMPQVIVSPHYSGDTVNLSALPGERFLTNLRAFLDGRPLEKVVDVAEGY